MSYQVLARKWRPKRFADLVGQEHVVRALSNALKEQRLHHAYLLTGTRGVGKTTIARILAKSLNCETGTTAEPCGECQACRQIDSGRFVDLLEIDAASNTGIDNIREVLENAQYAPTMGRFKVYIIDEVHMLSKSAFNAMLKTLEEPPGHVKFILATTDPQKVPVTVLSRCLQFSLRNMTPQQVSSHLAHMLDVEGIQYEAPALALLGRAASGSMRDAQSLLDQAIAYGLGEVKEDGVRAMLGAVDRRYLFTLLQALAAADGPALMAEADRLAERGVSFDSALSELAVLLQQLALAQTVPTALAADEPERDSLFALADAIAPQDVQLYYQIAIHGRKDLALAPDEHAGFNMALLRMLAFHPAVAPADSAAPARPAAPSQPRPAPASASAASVASASVPAERG
ncbi:DNA polymerase III subunit gamma/tau, partial [Chromobacterium piscinae]